MDWTRFSAKLGVFVTDRTTYGVAGGPGSARGTAGAGLHGGSWGCLRLGAAEASGPGPAAGPQRAEPGCLPAGLWAAAVSLRHGSISAWWTPGPDLRPALAQPHLLRGPSLSSPTLSPPPTPERPEAAFYPETKVPSSSPGPLSAALPLSHRHSTHPVSSSKSRATTHAPVLTVGMPAERCPVTPARHWPPGPARRGSTRKPS